jgi:hypothetical protein
VETKHGEWWTKRYESMGDLNENLDSKVGGAGTKRVRVSYSYDMRGMGWDKMRDDGVVKETLRGNFEINYG